MKKGNQRIFERYMNLFKEKGGDIPLDKKSFARAWLGKKLLRDEIRDLIEVCEEMFSKEPSLIMENKNKVLFVGDTHGDFETSKLAFSSLIKGKVNCLIFLGDYVDRGPKQIENITFLMIAKLLLPKKIFLLRGNHETPVVNSYYGFLSETKSFFDEEVYWEFNELFSYLPYAALIYGKVLGFHGGIPEGLRDVKEINEFPKGEISPKMKKVYQLMWNDPREGLEGFKESFRGPGIKFFGEDVFHDFVRANKLELVVRSHEYFPSCYKFFFKKKLLSIFSCRYYPDCTPKGAIYSFGNINVVLFAQEMLKE